MARPTAFTDAAVLDSAVKKPTTPLKTTPVTKSAVVKKPGITLAANEPMQDVVPQGEPSGSINPTVTKPKITQYKSLEDASGNGVTNYDNAILQHKVTPPKIITKKETTGSGGETGSTGGETGLTPGTNQDGLTWDGTNWRDIRNGSIVGQGEDFDTAAWYEATFNDIEGSGGSTLTPGTNRDGLTWDGNNWRDIRNGSIVGQGEDFDTAAWYEATFSNGDGGDGTDTYSNGDTNENGEYYLDGAWVSAGDYAAYQNQGNGNLDEVLDQINTGQLSTEERAELEAQAELEYQTEKAKSEAIARRKELMSKNAELVSQFFSNEYSSAQKVDKFGWTGGQLMDENTRVKFLQAGLNAKMYNEQAIAEAGYDNNLAIARKYADLKQMELANQYYQEAEQNALARAQITGYYISPEASDMIANYKVAVDEGNTEVMAVVESYFIEQGFGDIDDNGEPYINPSTITGLVDFSSTLLQRQFEFDQELNEYAQAEAMANNEYRENGDLDGDGLIGALSEGLNDESWRMNPATGEREYWSYDNKEWLSQTDHQAYLDAKNGLLNTGDEDTGDEDTGDQDTGDQDIVFDDYYENVLAEASITMDGVIYSYQDGSWTYENGATTTPITEEDFKELLRKHGGYNPNSSEPQEGDTDGDYIFSGGVWVHKGTGVPRN